jgi:hypothetical protein
MIEFPTIMVNEPMDLLIARRAVPKDDTVLPRIDVYDIIIV